MKLIFSTNDSSSNSNDRIIITKDHFFTSTKAPDTFAINYDPKVEKDIYFQIISAHGETIYDVNLPNWAIRDYETPSYLFKKEFKNANYKSAKDSVYIHSCLAKADRKYFTDQLSTFFDDKNFGLVKDVVFDKKEYDNLKEANYKDFFEGQRSDFILL